MPKTIDLAGSEDRLNQIIRNAKSILARAESSNRDLTTDEQRKLDELQAEADGIFAAHRAARGAAFDAMADELDAVRSYNAQPQPRVAAPNAIASADPMQRRAASAGASAARHLLAPGARLSNFAQVFAGHAVDADPYGGRFDSLGELARAIVDGHDQRLLRNATMTTTTGADGGFAVPVQFLGPILDAALAREVVRPMANVIPMTSKQTVAGLFDYADGTSAKRGGLQLTWGQEATALTEQKGKMREMQLNAHKGSIFVRVSNELLADAVAFDRQLTEAMVAAVASGLDYAFINGSGAGQPLGLLNAAATITVSKESGQAANTLMLQNLAGMVGRLQPASFGNSAWMVHPTLVPKLYDMAYVVKNVAGTENVGGAAVAPVSQDGAGQLRIYGRPVYVTDACSVLSAKGDIVLADLSRYVVGLRADATIRRDDSRYFDSDEVAFRLILRIDGQPADAAATKLRDGTNTVSPFVTLEAR